MGGRTAGGVSSRKAYARAKVQKRPRPRGNQGFTFESKSDYPDHDDALVVTVRIANAYVRCIMIDIGSSADILYLDAFHKLGMTNRDLAPMTSTLTEFTGDAITPVGITTLPMTFGDEPRTKTLMIEHLEVADALTWVASTDVANELPTIPSLYKPTVAIVEAATTAAHPDWREEILRYKKYATLPADKAIAR
ncbi:hypothetical protein B296_00014715 [Ensete ventricosum]|uniref:Peptidase A2 domain-containing protein n=1 Tax=Ensete ventricosum TaxID=4639 RepID=A0A427AE98_ENSVE|nr:hypothetical protein B296_00014715 [Ensete ventricosum]